mgnify:CR=1 FL=1
MTDYKNLKLIATSNPHIRSSETTRSIMLDVIIALLPATVAGTVIFGLRAHEVDELWRNGYYSRDFYHSSEKLKAVIDRLYRPIGGQDFSHIADYLIGADYGVSDPFMCLADFDSYYNVYQSALSDYNDNKAFTKKSLVNIATSGIFSSDNSIKNYANEIWHISPVNRIKI